MRSADVARHYREVLGPVYAWSVSQGADPFDRAQAWLRERGVFDARAVLDLGAGFGAHTVPLVRAGVEVTAVDLDPGLLAELRDRLDGAAAEVIEGDFLEFLAGAERNWEVVLCLGDTLPHLPDRSAVAELFSRVAGHLAPGGTFGVAWRDSSGPLPRGTDRFIPVARDGSRTMHCFLEEIDASTLRVTDLVTELTDDGPRTRIGSYCKLRLSEDDLRTLAELAGLEAVGPANGQGMRELWFR